MRASSRLLVVEAYSGYSLTYLPAIITVPGHTIKLNKQKLHSRTRDQELLNNIALSPVTPKATSPEGSNGGSAESLCSSYVRSATVSASVVRFSLSRPKAY
jgi:hypothetical protein